MGREETRESAARLRARLVCCAPLDIAGASSDDRVGESVLHAKFGLRTIVAKLHGGREKYEVDFEAHGIKKLLADFLQSAGR